MPEFVVKNLQNALGLVNKPLNKSKILILGVAYKNVDDTRESPALKIIDILIKNNVKIFY